MVTTASYPDIIGRHSRSIGRLEQQANETRLPKAKEISLDQHLEETIRLLKDSSANAQVAAYKRKHGREWKGDWVRVVSTEIPRIYENHLKQSSAIWDGIPDSCKFKRFQELFCPPERFVIPREAISKMKVDENGRVSFPGFQWNKLSVSGCLPRADIITDSLAVKLALIEEKPELKNKPEQRLDYKQAVSLPEALKEFWNSLIRLNDRIYQVPQSNQKVGGSFVYLREEGSGKLENKLGPTTTPQRIAALFSSSYSLLRATLKKHERYSTENDVISSLSTATRQHSSRLTQHWTKGTSKLVKDLLVREGRTVARVAEASLKSSRNPNKVRAWGLIQSGASVADSRGRLNPNATAAKSFTASQKLTNRIGEIRGKSAYNEDDSQLARKIVIQHQTVLNGFLERFSNSASLLLTFESATKSVPKDSQKYNDQARLFVVSLGLSDTSLSLLHARPFVSFSNKLNGAFKDLHDNFKGPDRAAPRRSINDIHFILKAYATNIQIEMAQYRIHTGEKHRNVQIYLQQALKMASQPFPFPGHETDLVVSAQQDLQDMLAGAMKRLPDGDEDFKDLKQYLGENTVEKVLLSNFA